MDATDETGDIEGVLKAIHISIGRGPGGYVRLRTYRGDMMVVGRDAGLVADQDGYLRSVLGRLARVAMYVDRSRSLDDWKRLTGIGPQAKGARWLYRKAQRDALGLNRLLGDNLYHRLLWGAGLLNQGH